MKKKKKDSHKADWRDKLIWIGQTMAGQEKAKAAPAPKKPPAPVALIDLSHMEEQRRELQAEDSSSAKPAKSSAKAAGMKSVFLLSDKELLMTSFGRGNDAVREKRVKGDEVQALRDDPAYRIEKADSGFDIHGRTRTKGYTDDPRYAAEGPPEHRDLIDCRTALEKLYFGEECEDNIHVQLAYSILDIEKILAVHVNNIIYELNNLLRDEEVFHEDWIGYMGRDYTYQQILKKQSEEREKETAQTFISDRFFSIMRDRRRMYFGTILCDPTIAKERNQEKKKQRYEEEREHAYYIFMILGMARQMLAHGEGKTRSLLFCFDEKHDKNQSVKKSIRAKLRQTLDAVYSERVKELNEGFIKTSAKDLVMLCRVMHARSPEEKKACVRDYYDFVVRKEYKNQGFSIKRLRETIILRTPQAAVVNDAQYDTVRQKLNRLFDFVIFDHYRKHAAEAEQIVASLRAAKSDIDKELIYRHAANNLWQAIGKTVLQDILPIMNGNAIKGIAADPDIKLSMISDIMISEDADYFVKFIYLLTRFQNGKEINDLLTTCINKFENITAFISVMEEQGIFKEFRQEYSMFGNSAAIAKQLREVNSFARMSMKSQDLAAKRVMFEDAADILGYSDPQAGKQLLDTMLDPSQNTGFRNFIASNVVESNRFHYLACFCNPKTVRKLAENRAVIDFVLSEIPDAQILRYYTACTGAKEGADPGEMRAFLAEKLTGITFEEFRNVKQNDRFASPEEKLDKVRKQAIIRLYLTALYLLVKNMVYVNSRYFLAFQCLARDNALHGYTEDDIDNDYASFARKFLSEPRHRKNRRAVANIEQNMANSDPWIVREYRNAAMHLSAIRRMPEYIADVKRISSYFELYHYIMQRHLADQHTRKEGEGKEAVKNEVVLRYFADVRKYGSYCKDFVWALNVPFAYNLPRYKNLSIENLFDRNRPGTKAGGPTKSAGPTEA
ncbi:MAG: type VI-D CRISPR-associated RNA-guided ribonuclease Cas13d [Candidatus Excrementavichristensenella sp.]|jgi:hypothetical protein